MLRTKKLISILLTISIIFSLLIGVRTFILASTNYYDSTKINAFADGILDWSRKVNSVSPTESLIDKGLISSAGTTYSDWYVIGMKRSGKTDSSESYVSSLNLAITNNLLTSYTPSKVMNIHRSILLLVTLNQNPLAFNDSISGKKINLVSEFIYNLPYQSAIEQQLINVWTWGLISLDTLKYEVPAGSSISRDIIIREILKKQKISGGFALTDNEKNSDPDITAMVIQALSPYYNSEKEYSYKRIIDGKKINAKVSQVVDEGILKLSAMQITTGDYKSWGQRNSETAAQVAIALCDLGIDPQKDIRFIKDGKTLVDGMLLYKLSDGGFSHVYPPVKSDGMASSQIFSAFVAIKRNMNGQRTIYDQRPEQNSTLTSAISTLETKITAINSKTDKPTLAKLLADYNKIPENEKMYVSNYQLLAKAIRKMGNILTVSPSPISSESNPNSGSLSNSYGLYTSSYFSSDNGLQSKFESDQGSQGYSDNANSSKAFTLSSLESNSGNETTGKNDKGFILIAIIVIAVLLGLFLVWNYLTARKNKSTTVK